LQAASGFPLDDAGINPNRRKKASKQTENIHHLRILVSGAIQRYSRRGRGRFPAGTMNQMIRPSHVDQRPALETLAGSIERITFHNPENGFAVLKVQARGKRDLITVVGHTPSVSAGEWITASGLWVSDRTHGLQFKAEVLKTTPPTGPEGIEKYLASGQMRGIGPAMAKRIVAAFGVDTFEIS
jgi:exodeoxyribonuclease V alpha subunit